MYVKAAPPQGVAEAPIHPLPEVPSHVHGRAIGGGVMVKVGPAAENVPGVVQAVVT